MGSRDGRYAALILGLLGACSVAAPQGFSGGDRWVFPLIDPLDDGLLVTPVMIDGTGPYLFAIDPDANVSAIDTEVVTTLQARVGRGPRRVDETGAQHDRSYTELVNLQIGNLAIAKRPAMVIPVGLYDEGARHLHGVIGRDILDDALVFGFNRDQGIAMLATAKAFHPPPRAIDLTYHAVFSQLPDLELRPVPRRLVRAAVNGELYSLHLDLGAATSQLRESHWASAGLVPSPVQLALVDEAGTVRKVSQSGAAKSVVVGPATRENTVFLPYEDQRWETEGVNGTLGLDFLAPFSVWVHPEKATWYLAARDDAKATAATRLARWGRAVPTCPHPGCVTVTAGADAAATSGSAEAPAPASGASAGGASAGGASAGGASAGGASAGGASAGGASASGASASGASAGGTSAGDAPAVSAAGEPVVTTAATTLTIVRDREAEGHALEVVLAPNPIPGRPTPGWIIANLSTGAERVTQPISSAYAGMTFLVVDVSPFPHACPDDAPGCIVKFSAPTEAPADVAAPTAPVGPPPAPNLTPDKLHRLTGDTTIHPNAATQQAIAAGGTPPAVAVVKVCLTTEGTFESVKIVKTSRVPAYDDQLLADIKATWTFKPQIIAGQPSRVCSSYTFRAH